MPGLDVVVTNYQTATDLGRFLDSFERFAPLIPATITVVNVDPDGQSLAVGTRAEEYGNHLTTSDNIGYARACNMGAATGTHSNIALFNADVELTQGALDLCASALEANPSWGVLGPRQTDHKNRLTHAGIFGTQQAPKIRDWHRPDRGQHIDVEPAVSVQGSSYFVKRDCWDELTECHTYINSCNALGLNPIGAFLPTPFYFEETWCSYHAFAHDWEVMYFGPVTIFHDWHGAVKATHGEGWATKRFKESQAMFRQACDDHGISHD